MKYLIAVLCALVVSFANAQVGPCEIVTIVKDGKITNCTVCGTVINCF
jgi:hypothetical protein